MIQYLLFEYIFDDKISRQDMDDQGLSHKPRNVQYTWAAIDKKNSSNIHKDIINMNKNRNPKEKHMDRAEL
jgi:hypothetical protein